MTATVPKTNGKTYFEIMTLPPYAPTETATPPSAPPAVNTRIEYLLETIIHKQEELTTLIVKLVK